MNALLILTILALASPIFGEEAVDQKNQQKRGVVGLGYGSPYVGGYHGLSHGYLNNPYYLGHSGHAYNAPLALGHGYNHAYHAPAYTAPVYTAPAYTAPAHTAPVRIPYAGYNLGHNLGLYNSW